MSGKPEKHQRNCPKCDRPMLAGFVSVATEKGMQPVTWAQGEMWSFLLYGGETCPIKSYRCPECGYLESYAK